jgi:hypothetical protein
MVSYFPMFCVLTVLFSGFGAYYDVYNRPIKALNVLNISNTSDVYLPEEYQEHPMCLPSERPFLLSDSVMSAPTSSTELIVWTPTPTPNLPPCYPYLTGLFILFCIWMNILLFRLKLTTSESDNLSVPSSELDTVAKKQRRKTRSKKQN